MKLLTLLLNNVINLLLMNWKNCKNKLNICLNIKWLKCHLVHMVLPSCLPKRKMVLNVCVQILGPWMITPLRIEHNQPEQINVLINLQLPNILVKLILSGVIGRSESKIVTPTKLLSLLHLVILSGLLCLLVWLMLLPPLSNLWIPYSGT